jgi:hypothetical protein
MDMNNRNDGRDPGWNRGNRHEELDGGAQQRSANEDLESARLTSDPATVKLCMDFAKFTSKLQSEMAISLMADPEVRSKVVKQLKLPEHELMAIIDKALNHFISTLPLATQMGENLFMTALAKHVALTGDPLMHQIVSAINIVISGQDFNDLS